jgi:hypothetical protein
MIKVSLETVVLLVIIVAVLVGAAQWGAPMATERLQTMMVEAAEAK